MTVSNHASGHRPAARPDHARSGPREADRIGRDRGGLDVEREDRAGRHTSRGGAEEILEIAEIDQRVGCEDRDRTAPPSRRETSTCRPGRARRRSCRCAALASMRGDRSTPTSRLLPLRISGPASPVPQPRSTALGRFSPRVAIIVINSSRHAIAQHLDELLVETVGETVEIGDEIIRAARVPAFRPRRRRRDSAGPDRRLRRPDARAPSRSAPSRCP